MSKRLGFRTAALAWMAVSACVGSQHVRIGHPSLVLADQGRNATLQFDITWPHSFRDASTHDAVWVFAKYRFDGDDWRHLTMTGDRDGHSMPRDPSVPGVIEPATERTGALIYRREPGEGTVAWRNVRLGWDWEADGADLTAELPEVRVFAVEMVLIPAGGFWLGDGEIGNIRGHFQAGELGVPFRVESESTLVLGGDSTPSLGNGGGYGMPVTSVDDFDDGRTRTLPAAYPKGTGAFYLMRYELTQRQYADFLNTMTAEQRAARNPANQLPHGPAPTVDRYSITTAPPFVASAPDRAMHPVSWADLAAFADWAALRPMTELEFEKAGRGFEQPEPGTFSWGDPTIHTRRYSVAGDGGPAEEIHYRGITAGNAVYATTTGTDTLTAGLPNLLGRRRCWACIYGPVHGLAFMGGADRVARGESPFRVMHLSGNLFEFVVSLGSTEGRQFAGTHGDGRLNADGSAAGPEVRTWPGARLDGGTYVVTGAEGVGLRGGSWASPVSHLRVSDRTLAAAADSQRSATHGIRLARTRGR